MLTAVLTFFGGLVASLAVAGVLFVSYFSLAQLINFLTR